MLPARFEYHRPDTLDEAVGLLGSLEEPKVLAGGQSLIPLLKLRFAAPSDLVDINRIPGLDRIGEEGGMLRLGALVRHNQVASSDVVAARHPTLAAAAPQIADPIVRNLGTMAGSLAHADPAGDWGAVMLAVGGTFVLRGPGGEREVAAEDFFQDIFTTVLEPDEILAEVRVPAPTGPVGGTYLKLERKVGDFGTVGVAVHVQMDNGGIGRAGIGLTAVGSRNLRAAEAEAILTGREPGDEVFAEAGRQAAAITSPIADLRGSAEYKRHMVEVYVRRGLARAVEMARAA
ncbi:MAG TPA: xanthine dehydrogenase family protein subunit M [Actinomycetota bacterium]|jgi:carbon-monoxide dehydrogenase medium subunit|nr:xanthine dehydrogenase family protein subunit M [Actinomycetota bacterium]